MAWMIDHLKAALQCSFIRELTLPLLFPQMGTFFQGNATFLQPPLY